MIAAPYQPCRGGVYATATSGQIGATLALFRHFRAFIRSSARVMRDPREWTRPLLDKAEAQRQLRVAIDRAILKKAGDRTYALAKAQSDYQTSCYRDQQRLQDIARRIRVYQFETRVVRERFSHLLSTRDE